MLRSGFPLEENKAEVFAAFTAAISGLTLTTIIWIIIKTNFRQDQRWQLTKAWQVELNYRWLYAANNHLDKVTINFHDLFDIDQAGRTRKERHQFDIYAPDHDINIRNFSGDTLTSAFTLYTQYQIIDLENHGLSFGVSLITTTSATVPSKEASSNEQSAQFNYSYQLDINTFYTSLG